MSVKELLSNNPLMMVLALIIGLSLGGFPEFYHGFNSNMAMASLMAMMSISLTNLRFRGLRLVDHRRNVLVAFWLSFILSSGTTIIMAYLFQGDIRYGWIMEAAVPSAVSVIPFTYILKGDLENSLVSSASLYIIALAFTPLLTLMFIGQAIDPLTVLWYVGTLILVPILISRPLMKVKISPAAKGIGVNIAFFVLVISVTGPNRQVFFGEPVLLCGLIIVAAIRTFGIGTIVELIDRRRGVDRSLRVPHVLFATHKNTGMAAVLAIGLLGPGGAVPATVCMTVDIAWLIYLGRFTYPDHR